MRFSPNGSNRRQWLNALRAVWSRPRLIDAFLFFNEIDLLEIRLSELDGVVDTFVILESDRTFAGRAKPYFFEQWLHRFRRWQHKIVYRKLSLPEISHTDDERQRFSTEKRHRDRLGKIVTELGFASSDIVVLSDVDEIWRATKADELRHALHKHETCVMVLRNHRGYVNNISAGALNVVSWPGPVACRLYALAKKGGEGVRNMRLARLLHEGPARSRIGIAALDNAGWHFSSMGGPEAFWIKDCGQEIRVLTGPVTRDTCVSDQRLYLAHAAGEVQFSSLLYDEFAIEQDIPAAMKDYKERYRRFFFFSDCV
jgi:beta-1,4-mannosyl-glycoprotein beta-1,4-N-acetylglucosaminyltransferase